MGKGIAVALTALVLLTVPASAFGEIRTAVVSDAQDGIPTVSGVPNNPDISQLEVRYDSAGSIQFTVRFYNSINSLDASQYYAYGAQFKFGAPCEANGYPFSSATGITGQHHVKSNGGTVFDDRASIDGFAGYLNLTRQTAPDGRSITISGNAAALANLDLQCLSYSLDARAFSSPENPNSSYDASCGCWYTTTRLDSIGDGFFGGAFFDGFPVNGPGSGRLPRPTFALRIEPKCGAVRISPYRLDPTRVHGEGHPFTGKFVYEVTTAEGRTIKKQSRGKRGFKLRGLKETGGGVFAKAYSVQATYAGDRYRSPSKVVRDTFRIAC